MSGLVEIIWADVATNNAIRAKTTDQCLPQTRQPFTSNHCLLHLLAKIWLDPALDQCSGV